MSRGRAPRPRAAASAEAPASPTCMRVRLRSVTAGSAPAPSFSASRGTPSGPARWLADEVQLLERWQHRAQRAQQLQLVRGEVFVEALLRLAQRLAVPMPQLAAQRFGRRSWSAFSCCRGACVAVRSSLLTLLKATAMPGSSTLHSCTKMMPCTSPLSLDRASGLVLRLSRSAR